MLIAIACACKGEPSKTVKQPNGLEASEPITCDNPGLRAALHFDRRRTPATLPLDGAFLAGTGLVVADFSGDGTADMFVPSETTSEMWITVPGETPEDILFDESGIDGLAGIDLSMAVGGTAVDYDGDGDLDLFVTRWELPNLLLQNDGTGQFTDVTGSAFKAYNRKSQTSSWADIDLDGDLDLFVGNYGETPDTHDDPNMAAAEPAELYRNDGGGVFTDISSLIPSEINDGYSFMSGWWDIDGDLYPELFSAHDFGFVRDSAMAINNGGTSFTTANHIETNWHPQFEDMGMGVADLNGDEIPDFLLSSWKTVSLMESSPSALSPVGVLWVETSQSRTFDVDPDNRNQVYGWGADFGDVDNDADLDALVTFGYWSTYTNAGDPEVQVDGLWIQEDGLFENLAADAEWSINDKGIGRGFVFHDLNADGYLDVIKREMDGPTALYLSRCGGENWSRVQLRQEGANTRAIGAKIRITHNGKKQVRWVHSGSSGMYTGNPPEVHFGLGSDEIIDQLDVIWPDGDEVSYAHVPAKRILTITRQ